MVYARSLLVGTILTAALTLGGCEDEVLNAGATIAIAPERIDFGKVATGQTATVELVVTNDAPSATLRVDRIGLAEGSAAVFSVEDVPAEVAAGTSATVRVVYAPDDADPDAGEIEIETNAIDTPYLIVPLTSERTFPRISVTPATLDLGRIESGGRATGSVRIESAGDATLEITRVSMRTAGFAGEACFADADCADGRCTPSRSGRICAPPCTSNAECASGYECTTDTTGYQACRETEGTGAPTSRRGFSLANPAVDPLLPGETALLEIVYEPSPTDRGSAQLVLESNDADRKTVVVPLLGRPDNLPPIAVAQLDGTPPDPVLPGTRIAVSGEGSSDPEGDTITYRWRFVMRPEGSRASFEDPAAEKTAFVVDRPGRYVAGLEVRDESGLTSTNDARAEVSAEAGERVRIQLDWDRPGTDLDLHVVPPGSAPGSIGDCFFDNPSPDWAPMGPGGDPTFTSGEATESIAVTAPAGGVYTLLVDVVAATPEGPTGAVVRIFLEDVEVAAYPATLPVASDAWDVATLTWPEGRITTLDTIR